MDHPGSVTQLMRDGDDDAYWALYVRYVLENERLLEMIRKRLPSDRIAEPQDVVADAFQHVWTKAQAGEHKQFDNRGNLLALLTCYAKAKASDARKAKRPRGESSVMGHDAPTAGLGYEQDRLSKPTEEELRAATEAIDERLAMLATEDQRKIARAAMEGLNQKEIAELLGYGNVKRVERAMATIRKCWTAEFIDTFRDAWQRGEQPGFELAFNQFREGGRWLLSDLVEIEIHQRLRRNIPVSLADFRSREHCAESSHVIDQTFRINLFYDEPPSEQELAALKRELDPQLEQVVALKLQGRLNQEIASALEWPVSSVKDTLDHVRQRLKETPPRCDAR